MTGMPGSRRLDHIGLTVRDLDEAHRFFVACSDASSCIRWDPSWETAMTVWSLTSTSTPTPSW